MIQREFMANHSSAILQNKVYRQSKEPKIAIKLSKPLIDKGNKLSFSGTHHSLEQKNMDSTRILGSETLNANQDHKRRSCFEKLFVRKHRITQQNFEDAKCALEAEVIDDTALIVSTDAVTGFKNRHRTETDVGYVNHRGNPIVWRNPKEEKDGKKKRNRWVKKQGERCSMKCLNEKKFNSKGVEDINTSETKFSVCKNQKVHSKRNQRKDIKNPKLVTIGDEEPQKFENQNPKIFGQAMQETDLNLKVSFGIEKELSTKLEETETVNENRDGLMINPVHSFQTVYENTTVGSKRIAYWREELETLSYVDEEGQKRKWSEVYSGFAPSVAREYMGLVVDAINRQTQRYNRVVNCGLLRHANAVLSVSPVLPLCSPYVHEVLNHMST